MISFKPDSKASVLTEKGIPKFSQVLPMSLQHVLAAIIGIVTPAIMVAKVCGLTSSQQVLLIQASLLMSAISTLLQCMPTFCRIGSRLPIFFGTSFAYVPTLLALGGEFGIGVLFGAQAVGAVVAVLFGAFFKWLKPLFPPVVAGTVVLAIGLSLYPTAISYMAGGKSNADFGSWQNWLIALVTLAIVLGFQFFSKGALKLSALLFGILGGYMLSLCFNMVDMTGFSEAQWLCLPAFLPFGIEFNFTAIATMAIMFLVNSVQAVGDFTATTQGGMERNPTEKELSRGVMASGVANIAISFFGGLPTASYSQNVGIVSTTKAINRYIFVLASILVAIAGLVPKFGFMLTTIPEAVLGGATISVFSSIAMTGMRMISLGGISSRTIAVVGISTALGGGIVQTAQCLSGLPSWVVTIFGSSPVTTCALFAILLNLILPKDS